MNQRIKEAIDGLNESFSSEDLHNLDSKCFDQESTSWDDPRMALSWMFCIQCDGILKEFNRLVQKRQSIVDSVVSKRQSNMKFEPVGPDESPFAMSTYQISPSPKALPLPSFCRDSMEYEQEEVILP